MPLSVVAHLIAHPGGERELATILQFRVQLAFQAQQDMTSPAPVFGQISGTVFNHPHPGRTKLAGPPLGGTRLSGTLTGSTVDQSVVPKGIAVRSIVASSMKECLWTLPTYYFR